MAIVAVVVVVEEEDFCRATDGVAATRGRRDGAQSAIAEEPNLATLALTRGISRDYSTGGNWGRIVGQVYYSKCSNVYSNVW